MAQLHKRFSDEQVAYLLCLPRSKYSGNRHEEICEAHSAMLHKLNVPKGHIFSSDLSFIYISISWVGQENFSDPIQALRLSKQPSTCFS